ncbi:MAG: hypothetical protein MK135_12040, partial [Polyangiaceae bacterium]|nr:hypothetical protein [Polyangiaceae bacterium]
PVLSHAITRFKVQLYPLLIDLPRPQSIPGPEAGASKGAANSENLRALGWKAFLASPVSFLGAPASSFEFSSSDTVEQLALAAPHRKLFDRAFD